MFERCERIRERMETIFRRRDFDTRRKCLHVWYFIVLSEFGIFEENLEEENKFYYGWTRWSLVKRVVNSSSTKTISSRINCSEEKQIIPYTRTCMFIAFQIMLQK